MFIVSAFNNFNFPLRFHDFVHSIISNFQQIKMISTLVHSFKLNFMILYIWQLQIWKQIWTICTSNVINFPLSLLNLVFSSIFIWICTILHTQRIRIFQQIHTICTSNVHKFSLGFLGFYTFNEFKFLNKFIRSVHLTYILFHWIFIILHFQRSQISQQV